MHSSCPFPRASQKRNLRESAEPRRSEPSTCSSPQARTGFSAPIKPPASSKVQRQAHHGQSARMGKAGGRGGSRWLGAGWRVLTSQGVGGFWKVWAGAHGSRPRHPVRSSTESRRLADAFFCFGLETCASAVKVGEGREPSVKK